MTDDPLVRGVSRPADRHGVGHPARPGDRRPRRGGDLDRWQGYGVDASYPGIEFNLRNDIAAANVVFDSGITVWQVPASVYVNVSVGYAELEEKIAGTSKLADYLISQLVECNDTWNREPIESRSLGDSPAISLILFPRGGIFRTVPAPRFGREGHYIPGSGNPIKVCESVDVRFLLEDMFAKIRKFGRTTG